MSTIAPTAAADAAGRRFRRWLFVFAAAAFLLRLIVAGEMAAVNGGLNSMLTPSSATDLATYMRLGREVASGTYKGVFYYQPFYYAVFLPLIYILTGTSLWAVVAVQSLLGALTVWLTGACALMLSGSKRGALAAAGAVAVSTPLLLYAPFHQNETLQSFNLILLFYLLLRTAEKYSLRRIALLGAVAGVAILTRGNIWLLAPLGIASVWKSTDGTAERKTRCRNFIAGVLLYLLLLFGVQSYFIIHNSLITGRLTGPSTAADAVLALGNSVEAPPGGRDPGLPAGPMEYPESFHLMMERVSREGISVAAQMWEWLCREPGSFLELHFRKALLFWDYREIPNNVSLYGEGRYSVILTWLLPGRSGCLLTLSLAGIFLALPGIFRRRDFRGMMLVGSIVIYWLAIALFYNLSRFRAPILPVVFTGIAFLWHYWESRPDATEEGGELLRRRRLTALLMLAAAGWLTFGACDFYRTRLEGAVMRAVRPEGVKLLLPDGRRKYFDHGPFSFGGWQTFMLSPGQKIGKRFAFVPEEERGYLLHITVTAGNSGTLQLRRSDGIKTVFELVPGMNTVALPVFPDRGGNCDFEVLALSGDAALIFDSQRTYRRSSADGRWPGGEWVMRLEERPSVPGKPSGR